MGDGIAADGGDILIEPIENIAVRVFIYAEPIRIHYLIEDVSLDIIIDIDAELRGDTVYYAFK